MYSQLIKLINFSVVLLLSQNINLLTALTGTWRCLIVSSSVVSRCQISSQDTNYIMEREGFVPQAKRAMPLEFGIYRICEQRRLRRACAAAQARQSVHCSHTQSRHIDLGPGMNLGF